jgi:hypothetical protein
MARKYKYFNNKNGNNNIKNNKINLLDSAIRILDKISITRVWRRYDSRLGLSSQLNKKTDDYILRKILDGPINVY